LSVGHEYSTEGYLVEILSPDGADESFHEWVRLRHMRHGLDLCDIEYSKIGFPAMEAKHRITGQILNLDSDFEIYRWRSRRKFELLVDLPVAN